MTSATNRHRYTILAIAFHWLIALGVLLLICIGLAMTKLTVTPMRQFQLYQLHKSIGVTVLLLSLLRLAWRFAHRPPPLPSMMPLLERRAASTTHCVLYGLMIGMPLTGWAMVSASRYNIPTVLYGLVPWPHLPILATLHGKAPVEASLMQVHGYGAWLLIGLLVLHAGAALRHHVSLRDDTLWRMLPLLSRPTPKNPEAVQ